MFQKFQAFYFNEESSIPNLYDYKHFWFYKSKSFTFNCKDEGGADMFLEENPRPKMELKNVSKAVSVSF